ncbi:cytochrome b [Herbaspirillum sp. RV1423]|uniref:cytochrome b n=1 Tax=Herbaspirillum sp. RV1423 TaxID=1443993 RepID=UPI0005539F50|nr:cytochrome b [Herbaspirillum sp. RV1423]
MKSDYLYEQASGEQYSVPAKLLHWILAVLFIGMVGLGWYMMDIEDSPGSDWYFNLHKSIGLLVIGLVILRAAWRLTHRPAPLPMATPSWQIVASTISHWALYALMFALPLIGIIGAAFSKSGLAFFGSPLPRVVTENHDVAEFFFSVHSFAAWILVILVCLHVLAGLKHLLIDKDGVFQRMWF